MQWHSFYVPFFHIYHVFNSTFTPNMFTTRPFDANGNSAEGVINPLSAMLIRWHHIIVSFKVFGTEKVYWNLDLLDNMFTTRPFDASGNSAGEQC